jgi:hypothetical protein
MERAFDLVSIRKTLRHGIERGLWTMEQLDIPPPGYKALVEEMSRHKVVELRRFQVPPYVNPLRTPDPDPAVQLSDPRDFTPTEGTTPAEPLDLPLTPEELDW